MFTESTKRTLRNAIQHEDYAVTSMHAMYFVASGSPIFKLTRKKQYFTWNVCTLESYGCHAAIDVMQ